jgi:hypothetical protein
MNMAYHLNVADLAQVRSEAHALQVDFQVLNQIQREAGGDTSSLSRRAMKAANDVISAWKTGIQVDERVRNCREITKRFFGSTTAHEVDDETKIWAIGHW